MKEVCLLHVGIVHIMEEVAFPRMIKCTGLPLGMLVYMRDQKTKQNTWDYKKLLMFIFPSTLKESTAATIYV